MITLRILLSPGRRGRVVDASGRAVPQPLPAPVIGSADPLRIILLDPSNLDPADPYGFDTGAPLRLTISGDWDPATIPVYATNALERTGVGTYDLADPSGTRTSEALALLGVLAERLCAWELTAYGGDPATEADWAHPLSVVQFDAPLRQRADSLGGDPAEAPAVDLRGPAGQDGTSSTIAIGETTTLPAGSSATVENAGTSSAAVLNFGIPAGESGALVYERKNVTADSAQIDIEAGKLLSVYLLSSGSPRFSFSSVLLPLGKSFVAVVYNDRSVAAAVEFVNVSAVVGASSSGFQLASGAAAVLTFYRASEGGANQCIATVQK